MMRAAQKRVIAAILVSSIGLHAHAQSSKYMFEKVPARYALVIGNADYDHLPPIASALTDAQRMSDKLKALGFKVTEVDHVASVRDFEDNDLAPFRKPIDPGDIVLFYFSGHGFGYEAHNFVAPAEMPLAVVSDQVTDFAISLEDVQNYLAARNPGLIIFLVDACRTIAGFVINPRDDKNQNLVMKGVANQQRPNNRVNTLVGYAAKPGNGAAGYSIADVPSLFTGALLEYVDADAEEFHAVFADASAEVVNKTNGDQWPGMEVWSNTELYLRASSAIEAQEKELWLASLSAGTRVAIGRYNNRHSVSRYAAAARQWLDDNPVDPPAPKYTRISPAAVERVWDSHDKKLAIEPSIGNWAFERSLDIAASDKLRIFDNDQLGLVRSGSGTATKGKLDLAQALPILQAHGTLIATRDVVSREGPSVTAAPTARVASGTPVKVDGFDLSQKGDAWLIGRVSGNASPVYLPITIDRKPQRPVELRKNLLEVQAPPRRGGLPDLVEAGPIDQAVKTIRSKSETITWVSLAVARTTDPQEADARSARLTHAVYLLKRAGIDERRITTAGPADDVSGNGVRIRFFGF